MDPGRDPETMRRSRDRLMAEAAASHALLVFTHAPFPDGGESFRLQRAIGGSGHRRGCVHSCMDKRDELCRIISFNRLAPNTALQRTPLRVHKIGAFLKVRISSIPVPIYDGGTAERNPFGGEVVPSHSP